MVTYTCDECSRIFTVAEATEVNLVIVDRGDELTVHGDEVRSFVRSPREAIICQDCRTAAYRRGGVPRMRSDV